MSSFVIKGAKVFTPERRMKTLEENMQKMIDMQRSGADIYFGGFAQMKRHSFFLKTCNWLMPFTPHHPAVSKIWNGVQGKRFLHKMMQTGSFCESDKYSFVLAFDKVVGMLPQKLLDMLENGEGRHVYCLTFLFPLLQLTYPIEHLHIAEAECILDDVYQGIHFSNELLKAAEMHQHLRCHI